MFADNGAGCDGSLHLGEVFFGLATEFCGFAVVGGGFTFLREGLQARNKLEEAEPFLAFAGEFDGLH